jgi:hypothetical protein
MAELLAPGPMAEAIRATAAPASFRFLMPVVAAGPTTRLTYARLPPSRKYRSRASYKTLYDTLGPKMRSKSAMLPMSVGASGPASAVPTTNDVPKSVSSDLGTGVERRTTLTPGRTLI